MSPEVKKSVELLLTKKFQSQISILSVSPVGGGCINDCYKIKTNAGNFFMKINDAKLFPGMFEMEAHSLQLLKSKNAIYVPEVIFSGERNDESFLILEFIESGQRQKNFFENFGRKLAILHKNSSEKFGFEQDNYIGSLKQTNRQHNNWIDFFIQERLEKQLYFAAQNNKIDNLTLSLFDVLYKKLNRFFPHEKPALLHGDLWSGNYIVSPDGFAGIIDPAVYFGFREMDIAMSKLFGGFSEKFYETYNDEFPMEKGWMERMDICNLYPLLVHVNLFGGGYLQQVKNILKRYE